MQTMAETLIALSLQDDALARRLLQRAQGAFQKWPEGFTDCRAQLQCQTSGQKASNWVQVLPRQRVEVYLPDAGLRRLVQTMLACLVDERTPRFFKDGDGRYPITFAAEPGHPQGGRTSCRLA
jgi:hypothetical protein